jgi:CSLREA domain-containing protein
VRRGSVVLVGIALALVPLGSAAPGRGERAFTVDSLADEIDAAPGDGVCRSAAGHCTLRAALNEVSALPSDGSNVLITVPAGTYPLRLPAMTTDATGGDLDLAAGTTAPPSVQIQGAGAAATVVEQRRPDRVLEISAPEPVTITNLTIRGGSHVRHGGGIEGSTAGGLSLQGVEVTGNTAEVGGGLYSDQPLTVTASRISDNTAAGGGGIAATAHTATISSSTIEGNTASRLGAGIWAQDVDSLEIGDSTIADNTVTMPRAASADAKYGGGLFVATSHAPTAAHVAWSTIRGNAAGVGGGIAWQAAGTLTVEGSLLAANTATTGGAIGTFAPGTGPTGNTLTFVNATVSGNVAEVGGALERGPGDTVFRATTIAGNTARFGSGIDFNGSRAAYASASGLIIANDPAGQNCRRNGAAFKKSEILTPVGTNLESGTSCHLQPPDRSGGNPRLGPLADNGGPTKTRALLAGSEALDRYTAPGCPATDQRGYGRPVDSICDLGSYERGAVPAVVMSRPVAPRQDVTRGLVTLAGLDACGHNPTAKRSLTGGYFEPADAQLAARGSLLFERNGAAVPAGDLLVLLQGRRGRVVALLAPTIQPLPLFDLVGAGYTGRSAHAQLYLTREAAQLLNRRLASSVFRAGMACGSLALHVSIAPAPGSPPAVTPPPPPPPPPPKSWALSVSIDPSDGGRVEANVGTISCPSECSALYADGTRVRLTAVPADGEQFDNWVGACRTDDPVCELTMDGPKTLTAKFKRKTKK